MTDLVDRLRDTVAKTVFLSSRPLLSEAADEIERLRLTAEEREAIEAAVRIIDSYEEDMDGFPSGAVAALRGLLGRVQPSVKGE